MKNNLTLLLFFIPVLLIAQAPKWYNQWVFGYGADSPLEAFGISQLDFNDNLVTIQKLEDVTVSYHLGWAGTFICDDDGRLILSSNNCNIRNRDFEIIENGDNLNPGETNDDYCPTQYPSLKCSLFLPELSNDSTFYLIHKDKVFMDGLFIISKKLYLSVVVLRNDGSFYLKEKIVLYNEWMKDWNLTGILNDEGKWWITVIGHNSNKYILFEIGGDEIFSGPTISNTGPEINSYNMSSQLTFSPDGTKLAAANLEYGVILYDFDITTGELTYNTNYPFPYMAGADGIMFSPNSRFIYLSATNVIYQMDLDHADEPDFLIQLDSIGQLDSHGFPVSAGNIYPGPDCRLYISPQSTTFNTHVIHQPDLKYPDCNYVRNAILSPTVVYHQIPNMPTYMKAGDCYDNIAWGISSSVNITSTVEANLIAYPNPTADYINFTISGDTFASAYNISLFNTAGTLVWSANKKFVQNQVQIDVHNLEDGLYVYVLTNTKGQKMTGRIVVMK